MTVPVVLLRAALFVVSVTVAVRVTLEPTVVVMLAPCEGLVKASAVLVASLTVTEVVPLLES